MIRSRISIPSYTAITIRKCHTRSCRTCLMCFSARQLVKNAATPENAQKFLVAQLAEYEKRLSESERKLAEFKRKNVGFMPDDRGGYFERLQREMQEVDRLEAERTVAINKRHELRSKLLGGEGSSSTPGSVETSVDARIVEIRTRLEELLLQYTDEHPDVVAMKETIACPRGAEDPGNRRAARKRECARLGAVVVNQPGLAEPPDRAQRCGTGNCRDR